MGDFYFPSQTPNMPLLSTSCPWQCGLHFKAHTKPAAIQAATPCVSCSICWNDDY